MKTNITKVKYNKFAKVAEWWTWKETCDSCGKTICEVNDRITLTMPDLPDNTKDFCADCLRNKLLDSSH